ncbi:hypothetical protein D3C84_599950 [compost metagenome]
MSELRERKPGVGPGTGHRRVVGGFTKGGADHLLGGGEQGGLLLVGEVAHRPQREVDGVLGLWQRHHKQVIPVAVVALAPYVVVELIEQAGRGLAHLHQHVGVSGTGTARAVVFKEDVIGAHAGGAGQHAAIDRIDVIVAGGGELVLDAQAQGIVLLGIRA